MAARTHLTIILVLLVSVTVLSWYLGTGGGAHPMVPDLTISAAVLFIALLDAPEFLHEHLEVVLEHKGEVVLLHDRKRALHPLNH